MEKKRLFVDMDGTLAVFRKIYNIETLYEKGYFINLKPMPNVIKAIRLTIQRYPGIEVYILSSVLEDSLYALDEKNQWLNHFLPKVDMEHRLFVPYGVSKRQYVNETCEDKVNTNDFLLDDYTKNLLLWEPPGKGIKLLNGMNHSRGTWQGDRISADRTAEEIADELQKCFSGEKVVDTCQSVRPQVDVYRDI